MTAVGVRLWEVPVAPSRGEVQFRIPSGQRYVRQWRVALGDIHLSGDIRSLHAPGSRPRRITHAATCLGAGEHGEAERTTVALAHQDDSDSGSHATVSGRAVAAR